MRQDKNFIIKTLLILSISALSSCSKGTYHRSYVGAYYLSPSIKLSVYYDNTIICKFSYNTEYDINYCSLFKNTEEYDKICEINQDINFKEYKYAWDYPISVYPDINSILITSDLDLDSAHPSGTSINNLFYTMFYSYHEFIDHGYKGHSHYSQGTKHYLKVSEVQSDLLSIINAQGFFFYVDSKYAEEFINTTHNITVTLTYIDGTTVSDSIAYTFQ